MSILPLPDIGFSVDDMGAAPPGWYTVVKDIEVRTLMSCDSVHMAIGGKAKNQTVGL
jgi:hypothetical protein